MKNYASFFGNWRSNLSGFDSLHRSIYNQGLTKECKQIKKAKKPQKKFNFSPFSSLAIHPIHRYKPCNLVTRRVTSRVLDTTRVLPKNWVVKMGTKMRMLHVIVFLPLPILFAVFAAICAVVQWIFRVDAFGYVLTSLGRYAIISVALGYCLLIAICTVFSEDEDGGLSKGNTARGWLKIGGVILLLTALWFGGCVADGVRR